MNRFWLGIVLGFVCALVLLPLTVCGWVLAGRMPVAVADRPLPRELWLQQLALKLRIHRESHPAPISADEDSLIAGAHVYHEKCALCHGTHHKPVAFASQLQPAATPLWEKRSLGATVGVSDQTPETINWKVANGIRLSGMPAFKSMLTETEIWQVSMLLANADKPLPPTAIDIVLGLLPASPSTEGLSLDKLAKP